MSNQSTNYAACIEMENDSLLENLPRDEFIYNVPFKLIGFPNTEIATVYFAVNKNVMYTEFAKEIKEHVKDMQTNVDVHGGAYRIEIIPLDERENGRNIETYMSEVWELNTNALSMSDILSICKCKYTDVSAFYLKYSNICEDSENCTEGDSDE